MPSRGEVPLDRQVSVSFSRIFRYGAREKVCTLCFSSTQREKRMWLRLRKHNPFFL